MIINGQVTEVRQKEDPKMYFIEVEKKWVSAFGSTDIKKGDWIEAYYDEVVKGDKTYNNITSIKKIKESTDKQVTLEETAKDRNDEFNYNLALMTRCYQEARTLLLPYFSDGFINPEVLSKTAVTLFLSNKKKS